jgi:hypothetical protein
MRECIYCGCSDFVWQDELECRGSPEGTGYQVLVCENCNEPVVDDGSTDTRRYVGL